MISADLEHHPSVQNILQYTRKQAFANTTALVAQIVFKNQIGVLVLIVEYRNVLM